MIQRSCCLQSRRVSQQTTTTIWRGLDVVVSTSQLKNYDECIKSFKEVVRINPGSFDGNYYLGLFYMLKGDEFGEKYQL